jgi:hypothetical protein
MSELAKSCLQNCFDFGGSTYMHFIRVMKIVWKKRILELNWGEVVKCIDTVGHRPPTRKFAD